MIGEQLGPYRVIRELGRGGMGSVWLGEHLELGHQVAIKVLLPQIALDTDQVQRFFNEARAAASVKHPGIVQVLDFGRTPTGSAYLAMELLEGQTLRARLRSRGAFDPDDAAMIARQVATTLAAAHAAGVVHRDLKPDNIMLVPDPEVATGERPKVLDFGIAKLSEDRGDASVTTRTGSLLGTPHYMSPEQCRGTGEVDARADVYALGCILFELVCGRPPFVSQGLGEIVGMHQFVPPPAPRSIRADVPEWLEAVILRALAKDPDRRFAGMDELARALEGGGAPAARLARASEPPSTETAVALAETLATPGGHAIAAAEVVHAGDSQDVEALTADAQRRALALAETLAREQRARGNAGRRIAVVAVAVIMLGAIFLYVRRTEPPRERRDHVAVRPPTKDKGAGGGKPLPHGSGAGSGTSAGTSVAVIDPPARDAGLFVPARPPADAAPPPDADRGRYLQLLEDAAARYERGDQAGGITLARQAHALLPDDEEAITVLAFMSCDTGDAAAAQGYFAKLSGPDVRRLIHDHCAQRGVVLPEP